MKYDVEEKERRDERHAEKHADLATSKQWYMRECVGTGHVAVSVSRPISASRKVRSCCVLISGLSDKIKQKLSEKIWWCLFCDCGRVGWSCKGGVRKKIFGGFYEVGLSGC